MRMRESAFAAAREAAAKEPTSKNLYAEVITVAKEKFAAHPSFYSNAWVDFEYRRRGGAYVQHSDQDNLTLPLPGELSEDDIAYLEAVHGAHKDVHLLSQDEVVNGTHHLAVAIATDAAAFSAQQMRSVDQLLGRPVDGPSSARGPQSIRPGDGPLNDHAPLQAARQSPAYTSPVDEPALTRLQAPTPAGKAFITEHAGKTLITGPATTIPGGFEKAFSDNPHMLWMQGRLVGGETPNRNNALWTSGDLELGNSTVAHGPLNWLHESRHVIGAIAGSRFIPAATDATPQQQARYYSDADRAKYAKSGIAMPDGSWPIPDEASLRDAIPWARSAAEREHVIKRAKALGKTSLLPAAWKQAADTQVASIETAAVSNDPHIVAAASIWRWIYPDEAMVVEQASELNQLWYSMECVADSVVCSGDTGCGTEVSYADYCTNERAGCEHLQTRAGVRRFANPTFLGAAVIVPPTRPGWADADARVMQQASLQAEKAYDQAGRPDMPATTFEQIIAQVLRFAQ